MGQIELQSKCKNNRTAGTEKPKNILHLISITYQISKAFLSFGGKIGFDIKCSVKPTVQFPNLADFYVYLTLISLSKINLYHGFKLWSRSARFSDDLQI